MRTSFIALACAALAASCASQPPPPAASTVPATHQSTKEPVPEPEVAPAPEPAAPDASARLSFRAHVPEGWYVIPGRGIGYGKAQNDELRSAINVFDSPTTGPSVAEHAKQLGVLFNEAQPAALDAPVSAAEGRCAVASYKLVDGTSSGRIAVCLLGPKADHPVGFVGIWPPNNDAVCGTALDELLNSAGLEPRE